jgi:FkbM family methyltransferase
MIEHQGIFLPHGEKHFVEWMTKHGELVGGKGTYQIKKLRRALAHCTKFRTAVDIGAHAGLWSMQLLKHFADLHAFEPVPEHQECFHKNVPQSTEFGETHVVLWKCALGERERLVSMYSTPTSSGDSYVNGDGDIPMHTLDSFGLADVDFIKVDLEGGELFALRGGEQTIKQWRPVIIVEQKPGKAQKFGLAERGAIPYLELLGYRMAEELGGDFIMVPN